VNFVFLSLSGTRRAGSVPSLKNYI